ncbi:MAG TPA: serine hydrolase [Candidatus Eisenbacteria bacterium]|nr:serine hydrolase [Candidatus Eisenbacteria bacterium]
MATPRTKEDWLRAARLALLHRGPHGVRVEALARTLGVTKGSFYWHFKDRRELMEILLREWEDEAQILTDALKSARPLDALPAIVEELGRRNLSSERGESASDAAIFSWAALDAHVAKRTQLAEQKRMQLFRRLTGRRDLADLFYYAYHGFLLRRRRVPSAAGDWAALSRLVLRAFMPKAKSRRARKTRRAPRLASLVGVALLACLTHGCTTMRILRHRDPAADRPREIFPQRIVHRPERPAGWVIAPPGHVNFDTVTVRDVDMQMRPLAEYLQRREARAFIIVRDDTILYERYLDGYDASTTSSSFSVTKSVTSALLGRAIASGAIRSLDDSVTAYVPELANHAAYAGVTLRQLLGMQSGIAYTRTNGSAFHDLRSDDAQFYYATNRDKALLGQKREDPPGVRWAYKDSDTEALGWALASATRKTLAEQLEAGIWKPIGAEHDASWDLDRKDGRESASSGLNATARDLAKFGRLYLDGGKADGVQIVPHDWVAASTTRDTARTEPEVVTWWQMQHQHYWWIPLQNWDAERDFFADGSRGQRIYVHPPSRLVIVQLANDSDQEFPFRKIVHAWMQEPFRYPVSIPNRLLAAARGGVGPDSLKRLYRRLADAAHARPADFVISEAGLISVGQTLMGDEGRTAAGITVLELAVERSPRSYRAREALAAGYEKAGRMEKAMAEYREALRLSPQLARLSASKLEASH